MKKLKNILSGNSPLEFPNLHYTRSVDESKWLNTEAKGAIIISSERHALLVASNIILSITCIAPESSIVFVGFQAEGTSVDVLLKEHNRSVFTARI